MATTISKPGRRSHLGGTVRSREAGYSRRSRDHRPLSSEEIRPRSIAYDLDSTIEEGPKTASSRGAAFVSGVKAIARTKAAVQFFELSLAHRRKRWSRHHQLAQADSALRGGANVHLGQG
jgi:hypothetical protein